MFIRTKRSKQQHQQYQCISISFVEAAAETAIVLTSKLVEGKFVQKKKNENKSTAITILKINNQKRKVFPPYFFKSALVLLDKRCCCPLYATRFIDAASISDGFNGLAIFRFFKRHPFV